MDTCRGRLDNPLTWDEIKEKFMANVAFSRTVAPNRAEEALAMLESLEEIDHVAKIVAALVI